METCPLCYHQAHYFHTARLRDYYQCRNCKGVFMHPKFYLTADDEKARYESHNNDVNDPGYQNFVRPIVEAVLRDFPVGSHGLDFGAGTGPVISKLLTESGYVMTLYDPYFHPNEDVLNQQYSFIVCCEVIEHFQQPAIEFEKLRKLILPGGKLYCMTDPFSDQIDFEKWYYKNDPTHVYLYSDESFQFIQSHFHFTSLIREARLIEFQV